MNKVEFNLLPDKKMDVVKARRTQRTLVSIAYLVSAASAAVLVLLIFTVYVAQNKQLSDANKNIEIANAKLRSIKNIEKMLTVQNQLGSISDQHRNKHITSRLFTYLPQVTPTNVSIGSLNLDSATNVIQVGGTAASQHAVNTFIDTLKFTTYTTGTDGPKQRAFPTVVETSFALSGTNVTYLLDIHFDPVLFSNKQTAPTLQVPTLTTTRSVLDDPSNLLFTGQTGQQEEE